MSDLKTYEQQAILLNLIITAASKPEEGVHPGLLNLVSSFSNELQVEGSRAEIREYGRIVQQAASILPQMLKAVRRLGEAAQARALAEAEAAADDNL